MFLRQFQYLIALEQEGHFGRAATRCNVSQPTLSSAIKHLEGRDRCTDHPASSTVSGIHRRRPARIGVVEAHRRRSPGDGPGDRHHARPAPRTSPNRGDADEHADHRTDRSPVLAATSGRVGGHPVRRSGRDAARTRQLRVRRGDHVSGAAILRRSARFPAALRRALPPADSGQRLVPGSYDGELAEAAELPLCLLSPQTHERQITDKAFASAGCTPRPRLESNAMIALAVHAVQGESATVVPRYFIESIGGMAKARLLLLEKPTVSQPVGLVWLKGDPMLPMTKAVRRTDGRCARARSRPSGAGAVVSPYSIVRLMGDEAGGSPAPRLIDSPPPL